MAKTSPSKRRKSPAPRKQPDRSRRLWRLLARLAVIGLVVLAGWMVYLDAVVTSRFEGRRFEVPSRVYARPLEIYNGASLSVEALRQELVLAGYRQGDGQRPGSWHQNGSRFTISTRGFDFPDGLEPRRRVSLVISGREVVNLNVLSGGSTPLVRLEPAQIGGIYPAHREDRVLVGLDELPPLFEEALLVTEDRQFYEHFGIAPMSIARAMLANIKAGRVVQGGSTLTQQLVKNFFLTQDQTLIRKGNEALMSLLLEWHYDKEEILETYINEVYLGQAGARSINGFGLASQFFFGESLSDLELHQIALLVGMVKGPSLYDPRRNPERAKARRDLVISLLEDAGQVDAATASEARGRPLSVTDRPSWSENRYPAYIDLVRRHLARDYRQEDLQSEGLRIYTTLDPAMQLQAEKAVAESLNQLEGGRTESSLEASMVVTSKDSGEVLALVGGREVSFAGFNRALDARRPIGSLVKPFVYLAALQQPGRYTLISPVQDTGFALVFENGQRWEPKNFDGEQRGEVVLHQALSRSWNLPTVRIGLDVGVDEVATLLQRFGVTEPVSRYPSMLLGAVSMSPVTVAQIYQGLATGGFSTPLRTIREVTDSRGSPLSRYNLAVDQVADPAAVHLVQYALQEAMREGTGRGAYRFLSRDLAVAGKTGTSDDGRDSWFAGFSGDLLAVAWMGRDDNAPTSFTGATGALPVWSRFMAGVPQAGFSPVVPDGVQYHWVNSEARVLTDEHCEGARLIPFIVGSEPQQYHGCGSDVGRRIRGWFEGLFQ